MEYDVTIRRPDITVDMLRQYQFAIDPRHGIRHPN